MTIRSVGILGTGVMGSGIARAAAGAGMRTLLCKVTPGGAEGARKSLADALAREVKKGRLREADRARTLGALEVTCDLEEVGGCDLVIESIIEDAPRKQALFARLDALCGEDTLFASNTSTLCITELAAATERPDRFLGLHFFNPVGAMKLVEVVPTLATGEPAVRAAVEFAKALGKLPVVVRDATGFVVNRLLTPYLLDAIRVLEGGLAPLSEIDQSMQLGCGHPMGPFALCDFIGLDIVLAMAENLYREFREPRLAPPPLLRRMVLLGLLGRKRGRGFYDHQAVPPVPNPQLLGLRPDPPAAADEPEAALPDDAGGAPRTPRSAEAG